MASSGTSDNGQETPNVFVDEAVVRAGPQSEHARGQGLELANVVDLEVSSPRVKSATLRAALQCPALRLK
eukprot:13524275-Alexandrium_andersonii.AAC.1